MKNNNVMTEKKVRGWVRRILNEDDGSGLGFDVWDWDPIGLDSWVPSDDDFNKVFILPWLNVLKAAKATTKTIANALTFNVALMFTFRASKIKELRGNWDARQKKIDAEMGKVMESVNKAMGADAKLFAFAMNPAAFLGAGLVSNMGKQATELWVDGGFDDLKSIIPGVGRTNTPGGKGNTENKPEEEEDGILQKLNKLFFFAHHDREGSVISEAEEKKELSPGEEWERLMTETGIMEFINQGADELIAAKQEQITGVMEELQRMFKPASAIVNATTPADLQAAFDEVKAAGGEPGPITQVMGQITAEAQKVLQDPESRTEFEEQVRKEKNIPQGQEIPEDALLESAEAIVIQQAKEKLQKQISAAAKDAQVQAVEIIEDLGDDVTPQDISIMKKGERGKLLMDTIERAVTEINNLIR